MATYKIPCVHCGSLIDESVHFCPSCASHSPFGFYCPTCLKPLTREDALCSSCGRSTFTNCPFCGGRTFVAEEKCDQCSHSVMIQCENKRCHEPQFFENTKCNVCGKPIKKGKKQLDAMRKRG